MWFSCRPDAFTRYISDNTECTEMPLTSLLDFRTTISQSVINTEYSSGTENIYPDPKLTPECRQSVRHADQESFVTHTN